MEAGRGRVNTSHVSGESPAQSANSFHQPGKGRPALDDEYEKVEPSNLVSAEQAHNSYDAVDSGYAEVGHDSHVSRQARQATNAVDSGYDEVGYGGHVSGQGSDRTNGVDGAPAEGGHGSRISAGQASNVAEDASPVAALYTAPRKRSAAANPPPLYSVPSKERRGGSRKDKTEEMWSDTPPDVPSKSFKNESDSDDGGITLVDNETYST